MGSNVLTPGQLEALLQSRLAATRVPHRASSKPSTATRFRRRLLRRVIPFLAASAIMVIGVAIATGATFINLTTVGASGTANGGLFLQGGTGAGTGNFDPFLTLNTQGNQDTEKGVNVCADPGCPAPQFDTFPGGDRTHALQVAAIPVIGIAKMSEASARANEPSRPCRCAGVRPVPRSSIRFSMRSTKESIRWGSISSPSSWRASIAAWTSSRSTLAASLGRRSIRDLI